MQRYPNRFAAVYDVLQQTFFTNHFLRCECCGNGCGVTHKGVAVLKKAAIATNCFNNFGAAQQCGGGLVSGGQTFRHRRNVGNNSLLFVRHHCAGTAGSAHHLVENEMNTITITNLADALEVVRHCGNGS